MVTRTTKTTKKATRTRKSVQKDPKDMGVTDQFPCITVKAGHGMDDLKRAEAVVAVARACESLAKALVPATPVVTIHGCVIHNHTDQPAINIGHWR